MLQAESPHQQVYLKLELAVKSFGIE